MREAVLEGVPAGAGLAALAELVDEAVWLDRSPLLSHALTADAQWRRIRHEPPGPTPPHPPDGPPATDPRRVAVAFAPGTGTPAADRARAWARAHGYRLLAPEPSVTAAADDKIDVLPLLAEAGVPVPDHVIVPATGRLGSAAYWPAGWPRAVLQRRENHLLGRGTVRVASRPELVRALCVWEGHELRLSRHVPGLSLTVTGCAGGDRTVVSAVCHQLVGLPELTPHRGTPCGSQLTGPADLPPGTHAAAREAAYRVGEVLRTRGYRGVFGLDLVTEGSRVLAVGINPRFHTAVSLTHAAERAAGLLPVLGLHILAQLLPGLPASRAVHGELPALSQILVHARRAAGLGPGLPAPGRYRLTPEGPLPRPRTAEEDHGPSLTALGPGEALCWPRVSDGDGPVRTGDELMLVQFNSHIVPLVPRPRLSTAGRSWAAGINRALGAEGIPAVGGGGG